MATLGEVIDGVTAASKKASEAKTALEQAEDLAGDAQALFAIALEGDTTGDKDAILGRFAETIKGIKELWKTLVDGITRAESVLKAVRTATPASSFAKPASRRAADTNHSGWPAADQRRAADGRTAAAPARACRGITSRPAAHRDRRYRAEDPRPMGRPRRVDTARGQRAR
ncbi:hypothetical protein [Saccharothrix texasensis]|uniref:Uncharacterized protein n=1 Tax=Saccharothrix texasensis TaxID=103734 RepID=A0A3N1H427_9PSEU|nr:hypothetical protein [Saccharothrix texasensis]ROP37274.1 hypothetical protein EDD40_2577 [Saccharothrix texasensis]